MRHDCEICGGSGEIRLPVMQRVSAVFVDEGEGWPTAPVESSRAYPCPECSDTVQQDHVAFVQCRETIRDYMADDPEAMRHVHRSAAHALADHILRAGFIAFTTSKPNTDNLTREVYAKVGVVSQKTVATMDQRIAARQMEVAEEVASKAAASVLNWGSAYTGPEGVIHKAQAVDSINAALRHVAEARGNKDTPNG